MRNGKDEMTPQERKRVEELAKKELLQTINGALKNSVLPQLYSLAEGGPEGWRVRGLSLLQMMDRAAGWISLQVRHGEKDRNTILTAHTHGEDHAACLIIPYTRHPETGELYLVTGRQNRVTFYFDEKEMGEADKSDPYRPNKGWISEFPRGFARPDLADIEIDGAHEAAQLLNVTGLQPWMPRETASDVRRLVARELGGLLMEPGMTFGDLDCFGRFNENSGNSTVFVHLFTVELTVADPKLLTQRFGIRRELASFHREEEIRQEMQRTRTAFAFGQEALSLAALWLLENSDRYRRLFKH